MDFEDLDYYELLGVERSASTEEIKRAFRREIVKYHPDRFATAPAEEQAYAQRRAQLLTEAQSVLTDFQNRNAYNRGQPIARRSTPPRPPTAPRDHQAELYDQAQEHLAGGRWLQAIGALRQLQQINPLYRDAAELMARAEQQLHAEQPGAELPVAPRSRAPLYAAAAVGALVLIGAAALLLSNQRPPQTAGALPTASSAPLTALVTTVPAFADPPTATPPATEAPTDEPTAVPTSVPTLAPSPLPTSQPTIATGRVLRTDDFGSEGWADGSGNGWTVGYEDGRYKITAASGAGTIWSFRTGPSGDYTLSADVQARLGAGGLMVLFDGETRSYVAFIVSPADGGYRLELHRGPTTTVLSSGSSAAILRRSDEVNRLEIRQRNGTAELIVNGTQLQTVTLSGTATGRDFGLVASAEKSSAEVYFDNLEIRAVGP